MHQNHWRLGNSPQTLLGELTSYSALLPPSWIKGPTSKGGEKDGRGKEGNKTKGEWREGIEGEGREGLWTLTMLETD